MLELHQVSVTYGRVRAVQSLSIRVREGEFVGLVGHNGAGKTSTLMAIAGVQAASAGSVKWQGEELLGRTPDQILGRGISLVPEGRRIFGRLTVGENLRIGALRRKDRDQVEADMDRVLERFPVLRTSWEKPGTSLSGGEQQQLAIGRALLSGPTLLLLDEPTLGLSPKMVDQIFETLVELHSEGLTVLLVEQNAARTIEVADHSYVLRSGGKIESEGTSAELFAKEDFDSAYIGL
jgi:branched-chain amino acid transport system ATP-binding protein